MKFIPLILLVFMFFCAGCSHVMSDQGMKLLSTPTVDFASISKKPEIFIGKTVLIGGIIENITGSGDVTEVEVRELQLFENGVPNESAPSGKNFLAVSAELIDQSVYRKGVLITIIGEVKGKKIQTLRGVDTPFPLFAIKEMRFFRPTREYPDKHANPYQRTVGDDRLMLSPPGPVDGEPKKRP